MDGIRAYILSVVSAAVLCSVLICLVEKKGAMGSLIRLIAGIFLAFTMIRPVVEVKMNDLTLYTQEIISEGEAVTVLGKNAYRESVGTIIKQETEAYILDKARLLNADITVDVTLDDRTPPVPCGVTVTGKVSSNTKTQLQKIVESDLGIQKEYQIWID